VALRIFTTKSFGRFCRKAGITDQALDCAVEELERGLIDADLGGGVLKKRIARVGGGKSGGFRTLLAFRSGDRTVFIFGFAKSGRDNISSSQLSSLKEAAKVYLGLTDDEIEEALRAGALREVTYDEEENDEEADGAENE
jgi:hypothetical protein